MGGGQVRGGRLFDGSLSWRRLRGVLGVAVLLCSVLLPTAARASASRVRLDEVRSNRTTSLGAIEVQASPRQVRAAVLDFAQWPRLFSDVKWVKVKRRTASEAIIEVKSRSLGPTNMLRVRLDDPSGTRFETLDGRGVHLRGQFAFEPLDQDRTRIRGALQTKLTGLLGWVVSERSVRKERQNKLKSYLGDIGTWFSKK